MWLLVIREPKPDAPVWPGRHGLAAIDAVAWPGLWIFAVQHLPQPVGVVGPFVTAMAVLIGLARLHRALCVNHRYWFTTWLVARTLGMLLALGLLMKAAMGLSG